MHALTSAGRLATLLAGLLLAACATPPRDLTRSEPPLPERSSPTRLAQFTNPQRAAHPGQNAFRPLSDGIEALLMRLALARAAERSLDLQYYIWHDDLTGRHLAKALLEAADRGVRVRILLDDVGAAADDDILLSLDAHPNIVIRLFNPIASRSFRNLSMLADFSRTNRRMHNKAFIADGEVAVLGGRNIGNEYFGASSEVAFGDLDVLSFGPVLPQVTTAFEAYWNNDAAVSVAGVTGQQGDTAALLRLRQSLDAYLAAQRDSPYTQEAIVTLAATLDQQEKPLFWGSADLLYDSPDKIRQAPEDKDGHLIAQLSGTAPAVQRELLVLSPYFIPGDNGVDWFRQLTARGVRVSILTNSLAATDVGAVHSGYKRYREALLKAGVQLYELRPDHKPSAQRPERKLGASRASLHAKTFVFDRQAVFIGSLNLDPRSLQLNTEIGLVCHSPAMAELLAGGIQARLNDIAWQLALEPADGNNSHLVWIEHGPDGERRHTEEPETSTLRRMGVWFLGLLPIESQL